MIDLLRYRFGICPGTCRHPSGANVLVHYMVSEDIFFDVTPKCFFEALRLARVNLTGAIHDGWTVR